MQLRSVITADVIGSRELPDFLQLRDERLAAATSTHLARGLILVPYTVTTWDEFQTIGTAPSAAPEILFDLRRCFQPLRLRIGVGLGAIDEPPREPINEFAGGEAFLLARAALSSAGERLTTVRSSNALAGRMANLAYRLADVLIDDISPKQWEAISAYLQTGSQETAAVRLGIDKSTVSRTLARARFWDLAAARDELREILREVMEPGDAL